MISGTLRAWKNGGTLISSSCEVESVESFLLLKDHDVVYLAVAPAPDLNRELAFFSLGGLRSGSAPIFFSTFVLPAFPQFDSREFDPLAIAFLTSRSILPQRSF